MRMEAEIQKLHEQIRNIFPDAVKVEIIVDTDGIIVNPSYRTDLTYSMMNICGEWVKKRK